MTGSESGHDLPTAELVERLSELIRTAPLGATPAPDPDSSSRLWHRRFDDCALEAFAFQYARSEPYRRLCDRRGRTPDQVRHWSQCPAVPTSAFKSLTLRTAPAREVFRSSGTTRGRQRSEHHHPFPELYRLTIDLEYPRFCLPTDRFEPSGPPTLFLVPPRRVVPDSSLSFMADRVAERHAGAPSLWAVGQEGLDVAAACRWLEERSAEERPVVVFATALALLYLSDALENEGARIPLPPGSVMFETGGFKGQEREVTREELVTRLGERLGVEGDREVVVVREYGMSELTSQCYSRALEGLDPDLLFAPPWMRVSVLDPLTLEPVARGRAGLLALFDLANVGSALHVLTEDLGRHVEEGFELLGRARGAELRGCSLTIEELQRRLGDEERVERAAENGPVRR